MVAVDLFLFGIALFQFHVVCMWADDLSMYFDLVDGFRDRMSNLDVEPAQQLFFSS